MCSPMCHQFISIMRRGSGDSGASSRLVAWHNGDAVLSKCWFGWVMGRKCVRNEWNLLPLPFSDCRQTHDRRSESAETCPEWRLLYLWPWMSLEWGEIKLPFSFIQNILLDLILKCNFRYLCLLPVSGGAVLSDIERDSQSQMKWAHIQNRLTTQIMWVLFSSVTFDLFHSDLGLGLLLLERLNFSYFNVQGQPQKLTWHKFPQQIANGIFPLAFGLLQKIMITTITQKNPFSKWISIQFSLFV